MCMMDEIRAKRDEIFAIARRHKAEKLCFFGFYAPAGMSVPTAMLIFWSSLAITSDFLN